MINNKLVKFLYVWAYATIMFGLFFIGLIFLTYLIPSFIFWEWYGLDLIFNGFVGRLILMISTFVGLIFTVDQNGGRDWWNK